ncbi:Clp protease [Roseibium aquae]|uniref:Clp protease n=2 Tax=Roseibium aquae TaxID=1323746 RepID=A0A916X1A5_9HYPH|nr:Clp protease [Roseibium aquae]
MRRKLSFWRIVTFVLIAAFLIFGLVYSTGQFSGETKRAPHIARIAIDGVIVEDRGLTRMIERIGDSRTVQGVIVSVNSPGGTTTGGEVLFEALRQLAGKKPVVSEIRTVGASAGYMVAIAADHTVARYNSITGSIGVLFQFGNAEKLLDTIGVDIDAVKSSELKAEPDFYSPATNDAKDMLSDLVMGSYDWFVRLVADRRGLDEQQARALADGRIFIGQTAHENGLIDAIGGEAAAISWLESERNVPADLPVLTWSVQDDDLDLPFLSRVADSLGEGLATGFLGSAEGAKGLIPRGLMLDGLVSVWHAPGSATDGMPVQGEAQ